MKLSQFVSLIYDVKVTPPITNIYHIELEFSNDHRCKLEEYRNKALLIVNIASKCRFTAQLKQLEDIYKTYHKKGLEIIGIPSNDFFQEPYNDEQIEQFCQINYRVSFPIASKTHVRGAHKHPLYAFLTSSSTNPHYAGAIRWNFTKFLINQQGNVINRFSPYTDPSANKVIKSIEQVLEQ